jgi:hypothetical protein
LLKLIYCLSESVRRFLADNNATSGRKPKFIEYIADDLASVFQPEQLGHLLRRNGAPRNARVIATWSDGDDAKQLRVALTEHAVTAHFRTNDVVVHEEDRASLPQVTQPIFLPTREVLSLFPGFISAYTRRELAFDRTFFDLCLALDAQPLRHPVDELRSRLLEPIERVLGAKVINDKGAFYLKLPDGNLEMPLVAEGLRKLAMLDYLVVNGSLAPNGFLLWDEPEASLNPRLTKLVGDIVTGIAQSSIQTWIATHDYALTSELTLAAERQGAHDMAFFALAAGDAGTIVERGDKLADLQHNAILQAFADLHEREAAAFLDPRDVAIDRRHSTRLRRRMDGREMG